MKKERSHRLQTTAAFSMLLALAVAACASAPGPTSPGPTPPGSTTPPSTSSPSAPPRDLPTDTPTVMAPAPPRVSAGSGSTCIIRSDQSVACWGTNTQAPPAGTFTAVAAGTNGTCAIRTDGTLACWGGDPESETEAPPAGTFRSIEPPCGLRTDGTIACWGVESPPPPGRYRKLALDTGDLATACAIREDGALACWSMDFPDPVDVPDGRFTDVSLGAFHACAIRENGSLTCWGDVRDDDQGQLLAPVGTYTAVSAGDAHSCAIRTDGRIACWGDDRSGQASPPAGVFTEISAGASHSCGARADGTVTCWGDDAAGGVALDAEAMRTAGSVTHAARAVSVGSGGQVCVIKPGGTLACWGQGSPPPAGRFRDVATGSPWSQSCGIRTNGRLVCWGGDAHGSRWRAPSGRFKAVRLDAEGGGCAIRTNGRVVCWASDGVLVSPKGTFKDAIPSAEGGCGLRLDGRITCWAPEWVEPPAAPEGRYAALAGAWTICGLGADGSVRCGGDGVALPGGPYTAISVTDEQACGLGVDGNVTCQASEESMTAATMAPAGPFVALSVGGGGGCAIRIGGELACWGEPAALTGAAWPVASLTIGPRRITGSTVPVHWAATDPVSAVVSYDVRYRRMSAPGRWIIWRTATTATKASVRLDPAVPGEAYEIQVRARAADGQISDWTSEWAGQVTQPKDDTVLTVGRGWTRVSAKALYGGSALQTARKGAKLTLADVGAVNLDIVATTCPSCGTIRVSIVRTPGSEDEETGVSPPEPITINLQSRHRQDRRLLDAFFDDSDPAIVGTLVIEVRSTGRPVTIDGVLIE